MTKIPSFIYNTYLYNVKEDKSIKDLSKIVVEKFSNEIEEKTNLLTEEIFTIIVNYIEKQNIEFSLSFTQYNLFKKYILVSYYKTLLHKINCKVIKDNKLTKEKLEKDLLLILETGKIENLVNIGECDLLNFITKQISMGYLTFWTAPVDFEFIISDNIVNYSKDLFPGGKLTYIQELKKTPDKKETEINCIEKSLDYFPYNYMIIPIRPKLAIVLCSPFMELYTDKFKFFTPPFSIFNLTFSGMKNKRFIAPETDNNEEIKLLKKQELTQLEMFYNNEIILENTIEYFSYDNIMNIKQSLLCYSAKPDKIHELNNIRELF